MEKTIEVPIIYYRVLSKIAYDALEELEDIIVNRSMMGDRQSLTEYNNLKMWENWENQRVNAKSVC